MGAGGIGKVTQNVEPTPGLLRTPTLPPMSSANCRQIANPSPVPPNRRAVEESACTNLLNSRGWVSASMPIPESVTVMVHSGPWADSLRYSTLTRMPPRSVNFTALLM